MTRENLICTVLGNANALFNTEPVNKDRKKGQPGRLQEREQGRIQVVNNMSLHVVLVSCLLLSLLVCWCRRSSFAPLVSFLSASEIRRLAAGRFHSFQKHLLPMVFGSFACGRALRACVVHYGLSSVRKSEVFRVKQ